MDMSRYLTLAEKAIPPQAKLIASSLASLTGCSANTVGGERDDSWKPDSTTTPMVKHPAGSQVCYLQGSTPMWITLLEDFDPKKQLSVLSSRPDGKKFYATGDYILNEGECR